MTEEEAKTKWCPLSRVGDGANSAYNRVGFAAVSPSKDSADFRAVKCIGRDCMAWRNYEVPTVFEDGSVGTPKQHGFCGAFGNDSKIN
jgi:hypothetical protein